MGTNFLDPFSVFDPFHDVDKWKLVKRKGDQQEPGGIGCFILILMAFILWIIYKILLFIKDNFLSIILIIFCIVFVTLLIKYRKFLFKKIWSIGVILVKKFQNGIILLKEKFLKR